MSVRILSFALAGGMLALAGAAAMSAPEPASSPATGLRPVSAFASIRDREQRSVALFTEMGKVIEHPRCLNCHPAGDRPTQTEAMKPHQPWVVRGADGHGAPTLQCATCHHALNFDPANVPGHPEWHLAPRSMAWQGKSLGAICRQLKDRSLNGGMTLDQIVTHMSEDSLVGWGWNPGGNRAPAPGTQAEFGALTRAWVDSGAACPAG